MSRLPRYLSRIVWVVATVVSVLYYSTLGKESYSLYGDALGYYVYLPSTFIYQNHKTITELPTDRPISGFIRNAVANTGEGRRTPKGYPLNQYTYGVALMEALFFFVAHTFTVLAGGNANGFTEAYQSAIGFASLCYGLLGLWLLYRLLRKYYDADIASLTTGLLLIGTNFFWFFLHQKGMAHLPLFFLFAALLHLTITVHESGKLKHWILLGLVGGLITVIRPIDGFCVLIPLLYGIRRPYLSTKLRFLRAQWVGVAAALVCFFVPILPQLLYWKWLTGYYLYDSYGPGQVLDFMQPKVLQGLFAASNGWLAYTPLMLLGIAGLFFWRKLGAFALAVPIFLILYIWGIYSWYAPHYPNGLGSRPMVDVYPVLAIPLAAFLSCALRKGALSGGLVIVFIVACIALNLHYSVAQAKGTLWSEDSKWRYNLQTLFRYKVRYDDLVVWDIGLRQPEPGTIRAVSTAECVEAKDSTALGAGAHYSIKEGEEYPPFEIKRGWATDIKSAKWVQGTAQLMVPDWEVSIYRNMVLVCQIKRGAEHLDWQAVRVNNKLGLYEHPERFGGLTQATKAGVWGQVSFYIPLPNDFRQGDTVLLSLWNPAKRPAYLSKLCLGFYR